MSTPDATCGPRSGSPAATASTQARKVQQHTPWKEPAAAAQVAKKARSWVGIQPPRKSWLQYPSRTSTPPPNLSFKEICSNYPNHLHGELLVEMSDAGLKPRDIVEMMPADTRNPHLETEWSWLTERTKKAKLARKSSQEATRDVALVKSEGASQPTGQGMPAKVVGSSHSNCLGVPVRSEATSNIPASHALIPGTMTKPIRDTPSPTVDGRAPPSSHVAVSIPKPTTGQLGSENAIAMVTPKSTHSASGLGVPGLATPAQIAWQLPQAAITQSSLAPAAATPCVAAVTPIAIDGPPPARTVITEGDQFVFQPSPPKTTPASQYSAEYRHKEGLREEIRTHLGLLVDISSMEESFVSRSQQQQQNDILLQWKKWCDDQSYRLGREHGVFVGP